MKPQPMTDKEQIDWADERREAAMSREGKWTPVCRCAIDHFLPPDESEIVFCPLHKAAVHMAEALREFLRVMDDPKTTAAMPATVAKARAALRAAGVE